MPETITRPYDWVIPASYQNALMIQRAGDENSYLDTVLAVLSQSRPLLMSPDTSGDDMVEARLYVPGNLKSQWAEKASERGIPVNAWLCLQVFGEIPERIRICRGEDGTLARVRFYGEDAAQVRLAHSLDPDLYELSVHKAVRELFLRGLDSPNIVTSFDGGEMLSVRFWLTGEEMKHLEQIRSENARLRSLSDSLAMRAIIMGAVEDVLDVWA